MARKDRSIGYVRSRIRARNARRNAGLAPVDASPVFLVTTYDPYEGVDMSEKCSVWSTLVDAAHRAHLMERQGVGIHETVVVFRMAPGEPVRKVSWKTHG